MFKKHSTITVTSVPCQMLEEVRFALEVLLGERIRFKHYEIERRLDSGKGAFYTNDGQEHRICFLKEQIDDRSFLDLLVDGRSCVAWVWAFDMVHVMVVGSTVWTVGTPDSTWEEPFYGTP